MMVTGYGFATDIAAPGEFLEIDLSSGTGEILANLYIILMKATRYKFGCFCRELMDKDVQKLSGADP